ncbi:MAG: tetratricopeptide repeat protein, partial [Deltaproteobacteria bacterium]|nr:tetratricopeptide repeat protein [Deltaproteobacteria bacterium]
MIEFKRSLKLNTSIDNQNGVCVNLLNLGRIYLAADRFDDARPVLERALQLGLNINDQLMLSEAYASLARYYYLTGKNNDAINISEKAAAIDRKQGYHTLGNRLNIMGLAYKESNRPEEAEKAFNDALAFSKEYARLADTADSFRGLGDIWSEKGDYKKAGELYENALSIDKKIGASSKISIDLSNLG